MWCTTRETSAGSERPGLLQSDVLGLPARLRMALSGKNQKKAQTLNFVLWFGQESCLSLLVSMRNPEDRATARFSRQLTAFLG